MTDWDDEWKKAHERSLLKVTPENEERWRAFWSLDAGYYLDEVRSEAAFYDLVVDRLRREGWVRANDAVLDVGCGPGTLALPLSPKVASVTALDEAEGMLLALNEERRARGMDNIFTKMSSWKDARYDGEFDLVLASLSPAVRCGDDLLAMERASRGRCCLITACPSDWMSTRNELWESVIGRFVPSDAYSVRYPFNLLLDRNRSPELFRVNATTVIRHPSEDVIEHFIRYFRIFTDMDDEKEGRVRRYVLSRSKDGLFVRECEKCLYLLCWEKGPGKER